MNEFNANKVKHYVNICGKLVPTPPFAKGDWVKVEDFEALLEAFIELKNKEEVK